MGAPDLRARIIDATDTLLRTRGLARLTTREIARSAGCSEGALYVHFPAKEELLHAVMEERAPGFAEALGDLSHRAGTGTVTDNLTMTAVAALAFYSHLAHITCSIGAEPDLMLRHRRCPAMAERGPKQAYAVVSGYVDAEQRLGRVDPAVDPPAVAALLLGTCQHQAVLHHILGSAPIDAPDEEFATRVVRTLIRGLPAPAAGAGTAADAPSRQPAQPRQPEEVMT